MSNCPGCDNSSTTYSRCNPPVSSNCTFYQGDSLTCAGDATFKVCKGDNLTHVQQVIFDKVCELAGDLNITSIEFPCSLQDAWKDQDPTILNLLQYVVDVQCQQNELLTTLDEYVNAKVEVNGNKTIDPFVKVCLTCCAPDGTCGTTTMLLSQALDSMIKCICETKTEAANALTQANAWNKATEYEKKIAQLEYSMCRLTRANIALTTTVSNIVNYLNSEGASLTLIAPDYKNCPPLPANILLNV
jgi:hypothetical protein